MSRRLPPLTCAMLLGAAAAAAVVGPAAAQSSASRSTTANGSIFQPLLVEKNSDLSFGVVSRPTSGNATITIAAATGQRTLSGAGALLNNGLNAAPSRASYTVTGEGGQTISINVPASFNMTRTGGSETIPVTLTSTATSAKLSGSTGSSGTSTFGIGGSLTINNTTAGGAYAGVFNVVVDYN